MESLNAVVDRFSTFSDYLSSSDFKNNPKSNIFSPLQKVRSIPAKNNHLLNPDVNREIAKYLNLKDFAAFSSINVDNYLSLRSDRLLVAKIIDAEKKVKLLERFEDLKQRASNSNNGLPLTYRPPAKLPSWQPPLQVFNSGTAKLTSNADPVACDTNAESIIDTTHQNMFAFFFRDLCEFAMNDSIDTFSKAHICSLTIDINNILDLKGDKNAVYNADAFLKIAQDVNKRASIEDEKNKLEILAHMIEEGQLSSAKIYACYCGGNKPDLGDWGKFLNAMRKDNQ